MKKTIQICPKCKAPLKFRDWSKRYERTSPWQEALADCQNGCGKYGLRYFEGKPTCEPYQVKPAAKKTIRGSYKLQPNRVAAIVALYGSVQNYLDKGVLVGMPLQSIS